MIALIVVALVIAAVEVLAVRYGVDTRDGQDWKPMSPGRRRGGA